MLNISNTVAQIDVSNPLKCNRKWLVVCSRKFR